MAKYYNAKYVDRTTVRNYNAFAEEYFCGTDINVEINGKKLPLAAIEYTLQEQLKPIYGYASRVFDEVAVGSRIVTGTFMIPVKNKANHPEFKSTNRTDNDTPGNFNANEGLNEQRKKLRDIENNHIANTSYSKKIIPIIDGTKVYLSPNLANNFYTIDGDKECEVLKEINSCLYIYLKKCNLYGYIKKGE